MKHTPGPWTWKDVSGAGLQIWAEVNLGRSKIEGTDLVTGPVLQPIYVVNIKPSLQVGDDGRVYAMLSYEDWRQFPSIAFNEMQEANAKLIAQAPAMYEFIKKIADMKLCAEDRVHCESQSGPYCGAHDFFISDEEIIEARKLLDTENPTS